VLKRNSAWLSDCFSKDEAIAACRQAKFRIELNYLMD
jgi:hypothetical protein